MACVKLVYDETQMPVEGDRLLVDQAPVKISDIDRNAIEEAVKIKEELGGRVTLAVVVTGPLDEAILKEALAMGADRALIVEGDAVKGHNPYRTAQAIVKALKRDGIDPNLVVCGEGSSDQYSCALPAMIAEMLSLPVATFVGKLEVKEGKLVVERYLEGGFETAEVPLPAVISVTSEVNEPRIPTVLQIMKAGKKERSSVDASELDLKFPPIELVEIKAYVKERRREKVEGSVNEVVDRIVKVLEEKGVI
ncbi:MAG: electron transfer flavoprotein subunit beta/FixA family protein [Candidatus Korarchaeota archaeon]|nr:electron transfer flavoprotein subunit beta/FixA family protein [Candidatus Korarchaeota archaeon]